MDELLFKVFFLFLETHDEIEIARLNIERLLACLIEELPALVKTNDYGTMPPV